MESCDYTTLQSAIDSDYEVFRVVTENYPEHLAIEGTEINLMLIGGFVSCDAAAQDTSDDSRFTVNGNGQMDPIVSVTGNLVSKRIEMSHMIITDGNNRGLYINVVSTLVLDDVWVTQNTSDASGGGIYMHPLGAKLKRILPSVTSESLNVVNG